MTAVPVMYVKGAPEVILNKCTHEQVDGVIRPLSSVSRETLLQQNAAMAADALRVLALAYKLSASRLPTRSNQIWCFLALWQ